MVQHSKRGPKGSPNGTPDNTGDFSGSGDDFAMAFSFKDLVDVCVENTALGVKEKLPNGMYFVDSTPKSLPINIM